VLVHCIELYFVIVYLHVLQVFFFYYFGTGGWGPFLLLWNWGLGPFQLGKMVTKQEICEISFYIIYSHVQVVIKIKHNCFFSWTLVSLSWVIISPFFSFFLFYNFDNDWDFLDQKFKLGKYTCKEISSSFGNGAEWLQVKPKKHCTVSVLGARPKDQCLIKKKTTKN
jgi:hypothetical protein